MVARQTETGWQEVSSVSMLDEDAVVAAAFQVAFPLHDYHRTAESYSAQKVFELYFREFHRMRSELAGAKASYDRLYEQNMRLRQEVDKLRAKLGKEPLDESGPGDA
jgi:hypothetical protein